jgi:2-dehydropantoate 2-reductase
MKICVLGCGATGSVFASYLMKGGADDIWLVDLNKAHMDAIRDNGLLLKDPDGESLLKGFHTAYSADEVGPCDILIVLVKSTHTHSAMQGAASCITEKTAVVSLQNGLGNDLDLAQFVPENQIGCGCGRLGTVLESPGVCVSKPAQGITNMYIGPVYGGELAAKACKYIVDCFAKGGLNPEYLDDVRPALWKKAAANSGFNTVCAVLGLTMRQVHEDETALALVKQVLKEASDTAAALHIADNLYDGLVSDIPKAVASYGDYYPSLAQDFLIYKRQTEVNTLSGAISRFGKIAGVQTPTCDVLSQIVTAVQANYDKRYKDKD